MNDFLKNITSYHNITQLIQNTILKFIIQHKHYNFSLKDAYLKCKITINE